jgi:nucleoside-triphosphatase
MSTLRRKTKISEDRRAHRVVLSALPEMRVVTQSTLRARRLVVIDEIGPMEIRSAMFRRVVNEALNSGAPVLATIVARPLPFTDAIKSRSDVSIVEVRVKNRDKLVSELLNRFSSPNSR